LENKKPPDFANEEWRKFDEPPKTVWRAGLILLFAEKLREQLRVERCWLRDKSPKSPKPLTINQQLKTNSYFQRRGQSNRYPDFGFKPYSTFPILRSVVLEFVAVTVAQPSRIHTGFPDI
jgi:hypothetical protein